MFKLEKLVLISINVVHNLQIIFANVIKMQDSYAKMDYNPYINV